MENAYVRLFLFLNFMKLIIEFCVLRASGASFQRPANVQVKSSVTGLIIASKMTGYLSIY